MLAAIFIKLSVVALIVQLGKSELFSAVTDGENFLRNELYTLNILDDMIEAEQKKVNAMKCAVDQYRSSVMKGLTVGLNNPVHFYTVVKSLTNSWKEILKLSNFTSYHQIFRNISSWRELNSLDVPTYDDVKQSRIGLLRLQETYDLKPVDVAVGKIAGVAEVGASFDAEDCYEMGLLYAGQRDYYTTLLWMDESLKRFGRKTAPHITKMKIDAMEHFAFSLFKQGNIERALLVTFDLMELDPNNQRFKNNVKYYERILSQQGYKYDAYGNPPPLRNIKHIPTDSFSISYERFKKLCQGKYSSNEQNKSKLNCFYKMDHPFLHLAPLKVEIVNLNPKILLFRQVLSNKEIEIIEDLTKPKLRRATVQNSGQCTPSTSRVAKSGWLRDEEHIILPDIDKRIAQMTNLDMASAEILQQTVRSMKPKNETVHSTTAKREMLFGNTIENDVPKDDRIATVLFYMSTPLAGGATIFPDLNLTLYPSKNDAIFWYNILRSGEPDMLTKHAGCPVLSGIKWVANKWIHERGQEFLRPCSLNRHKGN